MDWSPLSFFGQMISNKVVDDTMYLCLGNGGDASSDSQAGVIIFGTTKITVAGASAGGDVVTMTMVDSKNLKDANGNKILHIDSMWVQLTSLSIVSINGGSSLLAMSSGYYIIDSGTGLTTLMPDAFASFNAAFCNQITGAVDNNPDIAATCAANGDAASRGYIINLSASNLCRPTTTQLNNIFPNVSFSFTSASAAVNYKPSAYMIYQGQTGTDFQYFVPIKQSSHPMLLAF